MCIRDRTSIDASVGAIGGHIQANGGIVITPFSMDLNLQSSGLSIADLTPYISQYSSAHVTQGKMCIRDSFLTVPSAVAMKI